MIWQVARGTARAIGAIDGSKPQRDSNPYPLGTPKPFGPQYHSAPPANRQPNDASELQDLTGAMVLDTLDRLWFDRYYKGLTEDQRTFLALWAAHTHYREADGTLAFRVTPRAYFLSKEPDSGKTLLLMLLALVSAKVNGIELEPTAPGLKMIMGREKGTAFLDEADILFGAGRRKEGVRAILNGGYSRVGFGATVTTGIGGKPDRTPVFGPVALAGLDVMETGTGDALKALLSRGVRIRLTAPDLALIRNAPKLEADLVRGRAEKDAEAGRQALEWMAAATYEEVTRGDAWDVLPDGLSTRAQQIWEPLFRIARAAGGDWLTRAQAAALALSGTGASARAPHVARLLASFGQPADRDEG